METATKGTSGNYHDNCIRCGNQMKSGHRSGTCTNCRTIDCAHPDCTTKVIQKTNAKTFCVFHSSHRKVTNRQGKVYAEGV